MIRTNSLTDFYKIYNGGAENAGRENAGHENDGPSSRT